MRIERSLRKHANHSEQPQALLRHSDLETTLNVYTHVIPEAQRRAVDKIADVLFTDVHKISAAIDN